MSQRPDRRGFEQYHVDNATSHGLPTSMTDRVSAHSLAVDEVTFHPVSRNATAHEVRPAFRLAFVAASYIQARDGVSIYIENVLAAFAREVFRRTACIVIDVFVPGSALADLSSLVAAELCRTGDDHAIANLTFRPIGEWLPAGRYVLLPGMLRHYGPYDLVFLPNFIALAFAGAPVLSVLHDLTFKISGQHFPVLRRLYMESIILWRLLFDRYLGVISRWTEQNVDEFYGRLVRPPQFVLPNGIPFKLQWFDRPSLAEKNDILQSPVLQAVCVGKVNYLKGIDRVMQVCKALNPLLGTANKSLVLHLVGKDTPDTEAILRGVSFDCVSIKRHGYLSDKDLSALYAASAFCFFLSRNEGFGLPLIEALWFRCVPILSSSPIFAEIMEQDYPLFDCKTDKDADVVARFALRLCDDPVARAELLDIMDRTLLRHQDGYVTSARQIVDLCLSMAA